MAAAHRISRVAGGLNTRRPPSGGAAPISFSMRLDKEMSYENPPDTCPYCEKYHVYRNGRCYECEQAAREARGDEQRERETIERLRDRSSCED